MSDGNRVVGLWEMLELNATAFVDAITEMRRVKTIVEHGLAADSKNEVVAPELRERMANDVSVMMEAVGVVGARAAYKSAERLRDTIADPNSQITYSDVGATIADVESRLRDELDFIKLFVINDHRVRLFGDAHEIVGEELSLYFPTATFEIEEAAKCLALRRSTAAVFHAMRIMEIGIKALGKHIGIEDPAKATDRSWGNMLRAIRTRLDERFPAKERFPGTDGADLENLYATLDAVKNPWRNSTMHVEAVYTEADANHIVNCVVTFMQKLAARCDEDGLPLVDSTDDDKATDEAA